ncbi:Rodlet protein [Cladobotryum mycophilum]|uniref:Hydrophobin n=1 Tax=Cladobotryum mycophilum TaxID=491253 RepID=A0ABR0STE9_9HYPO
MKFFVTVALLAAVATAAPEIRAKRQYPTPGDIPLNEAHLMCGNDLTLHCCNKYDGSTKNENQKPTLLGGLLGNILDNNGVHLFDQCSPLSVAGIPGGGDILNSHCKVHAACCQQSPSIATNGLVNIAMPCISLGSLLG